MIQFSVSSRERRALAIGAVAIGVLLLVGPGRRAEHDWALRSHFASQRTRAQLRHDGELVHGATAFRDSLTSRRARFRGLTQYLLTADTRAAAGPALAGLASRLSAAASLTVSGMDVQVDSALSHPLAIATVHMSGIGDVNGVASFLTHCEASPARIAIRALSIAQPEPAAPNSRMEALRIDVTLSALVATWHTKAEK